MRLFTIGFTKKNAEHFFSLLKDSKASCLVDIRLNNVSQLAGFAKKRDLEFFARELCGMSYNHELLLAPTKDFLDSYKRGNWSWEEYESRYLALLSERRVEHKLDPRTLNNAVLLCSESTADKCHRRLAAEYLAESWARTEIVHL